MHHKNSLLTNLNSDLCVFLVPQNPTRSSLMQSAPVFCHNITNYYLQYYRLLFFTDTRSVSETAHYFTQIGKLVENCFRR